VIRGLQALSIEHQPDIDLADLTAGPMTLVEVTLSPYASEFNQSLSDLRFREKFGMNVLAIWHRGRAYFSDLGRWRLQLGDAMLLYGSQDSVRHLHSDPNILVLEEDSDEDVRRAKAPIAVILMIAVVMVTILGWLTLPIAAIIGATLMVLMGCLTMDEAYRYIEWKAVFLIAGMLPLGIALEETGAAAFLAETMLEAIGGYGPFVVLAGIFALTALLAQFMPNPVVAVLLGPIALNTAAGFGISPYAFVMAVALAASASFLTPIAHPANILVMGPGGYRFTDYIKAGLPMLFLLLITAVVVLPILWPFTPTG
jgi:di/tricarboxylate transporter